MSSYDPTLCERAYALFSAARRDDRTFSHFPLPYEEFEISGPVRLSTDMQFLFVRQANDCARELLNEIHDLLRFLRDLHCWIAVLKSFPDDDQFSILVEFIDERARFNLGRPYALKNRFIYSAVTVSSLYKPNHPKKKFFADKNISYKTLRLAMGDWPNYSDFEAAIGKLNSAVFEEATFEFRNRDHHRIPPNIEIGLCSTVSIDKNADGSRSFSVGTTTPLRLSSIYQHLEAELAASEAVLRSFWKMITARLADW